MVVPDQINKTVCLSYDNFDTDVFDALPDFIKDKMKGSVEYAAMKQPNLHNMDNQQAAEPVDDLPF